MGSGDGLSEISTNGKVDVEVKDGGGLKGRGEDCGWKDA